MFENVKEYFVNSSFFSLFGKGFKLLQRAFIPSYIAKFLAYVIVIALAYLTGTILYNLWKDIFPPDPNQIPYKLLYISLGIIFVFIFIAYLISLIASLITYHSITVSLTGRHAKFSSVVYAFKNILKCLLAAFIVIVGSLAYFVIGGVLAYYLGQTGFIILGVMVLVYFLLVFILYPIFSQVVPIMVMEKKGLFAAIGRAFTLGFKNYWKIFGVSLINILGIIGLTLFFAILFFVLLRIGVGMLYHNIPPVMSYVSIIDTMTSLSVFWIMLIVYVCVISLTSVLSSSLIITSLCSIMGKESSPKKAFDRIKESIA